MMLESVSRKVTFVPLLPALAYRVSRSALNSVTPYDAFALIWKTSCPHKKLAILQESKAKQSETKPYSC